MSKQSCSGVYVELFVPDFDRAKEFYGRLGFRVIWEQRQTNGLRYMVMAMQGVSLNFYGGEQRVYDHSYFKQFPWDTPRGYGAEIIITVDDIEAYYQELSPWIGPYVAQPLMVKPWGKKDFRMGDPFGFYLRFTEPIDWSRSSSEAPAAGVRLEQPRIYVVCAIADMNSYQHVEELVAFLRGCGFKYVSHPKENPIDHSRDWRTAERHEIRRMYQGLEHFISHEVDALVAHLDGASDGRALELALAHRYGKPTIGFAPNPINSPWRFVHLTSVANSQDEVATLLRQL